MTDQFFWRCADLPFAECRRALHSTNRYLPHTHPYVSIGCIDAGQSVFTHGARKQLLQRGDVVWVPAGQVHACNPHIGSAWAYRMLNLDETWLRGIVGELGGLSPQTLTREGTNHPSGALHAALCKLTNRLFSQEEAADKEAALIRFAGDVFGQRKAVAGRIPELAPARLKAIQSLIMERCTETLPLQELANAANMSRYHFVRAFRQSVGMTPHAWQLDARINRARVLLDQDYSLAEIALLLGFADQSHFHRIFKQRVAATPGQFRRNFVQDPAS